MMTLKVCMPDSLTRKMVRTITSTPMVILFTTFMMVCFRITGLVSLQIMIIFT